MADGDVVFQCFSMFFKVHSCESDPQDDQDDFSPYFPSSFF